MAYAIKKITERFKTKLFSVLSVDLEQPDGKIRPYDLIDIQNAVTILPIDEEGNVFFVRQFRIGAGRELLELPAGKVEPGEDPLETAHREVREETGMSAAEMIPLGKFFMTPGYANEYMFAYLARGLTHAPLAQDADEFINLVKLPLQEVNRMVDDGEFEDSKTLAVLLLAEKHLSANNWHKSNPSKG